MATDNYQSRYWDMEWVGKLPTDWEFIKNRYIFNFNHGKINLSNDTPVLSLTTTGVKIKTNLNFGKSTENYVGHQLVFPGDLVFTPRDFDQTPILSGVAKEYGCISNLYFVMKTKKEIYNEFVNYFWWGIKYGIEYFKEFSYGMRSSFNRFQFNEITFIKPPIETQKKIVSYLDKKTKMIALIIEKKKKLIELLKEKRISAITQAVTKGLDPKVKMKSSGIKWLGDIPLNWERLPLKYIFSHQSGGVWGNEKNNDINNIICIRVADFNLLKFTTKPGKYTYRNIPNITQSLLINDKSVLIEKSGGGDQQPVGRAVRYLDKERATCSNFIQKLQVKNRYNSEYIVYLLSGLYFFGVTKNAIKQTTGIQNLDIGFFLRTDILYWPRKLRR